MESLLVNREEACHIIGIGQTKFDELVREGKLPKPVRIGRRVLYSRERLHEAVKVWGKHDD